MNKILYIIPGWEETTRRKPYQQLRLIAREKGYQVIFHNVDWNKPLSQQTITVPQNTVIFGFSLGAILAWLIAQKNPIEKLILASMTPHYSFEKKEIHDALVELTGKKFTQDIIDHLNKKHKAKKEIIIYGDQENEPADILVKDTDHEINQRYLEVVKKIL
jgi:dienelactone hydrolase